jgi:small subunit ribosomal protein S16
MAVRIRLKRTGRKGLPFYRLCAFDSRTKRDGKALEILGTYDPRGEDDTKLNFKRDRIEYWLDHGALPTDKVAALLKKVKVLPRNP